MAFVETLVQGLRIKGNARAVAVANIASLSGTTTIDGVALVAEDVVLLTAQTTATENGAWKVQAGAWVRPDNFAAGASAANAIWAVEAGTTYADTRWWCTDDSGAAVIDTNSLSISQMSGGVAAWGSISGLLSDQTDLQAALDGKSATGHNHSKSDITDFPALVDQAEAEAGSATTERMWSALRVAQAIAQLAAAASHTHGKTDITDLSTVSQAEAEAGAATDDRLWTAQRVKQAIDALAPVGGGGGSVNAATTQLSMAADQTSGITAGSPVLFDTATGSLSVSSGRITIPADTEATLLAQVEPRLANAGDIVEFQWYDVTNSAYVGQLCPYVNIGRSSTTTSHPAVIAARVAPSVHTDYELRIKSISGTAPTTLQSRSSFAQIVEYAPLTTDTVVHEVATATDSIDITLPSGWKHVDVTIIADNPTGSLSELRVYINGDITPAYYDLQAVGTGNGGTPAGPKGDYSSGVIGSVAAGGNVMIDGRISVGARLMMRLIKSEWDGADNQAYYGYSVAYMGTNPTAITEVNIRASVAASIAVGSKIIIRNLVGNT
jgi:hypothetical protein